MNVAIVVKGFPPDAIGGMETQTKRMAAELVDRGHRITVYTKRYAEHDDTNVDFEVVRVPNIRYNPFLSDLSFLFGCLLLLLRRSREHDLLHCMMFYPVGFLGLVANLLTGLPYFAWIRGGDYYLMRNVRWKRWMMQAVLRDTLVLAQSHETKRDVEVDFSPIECTIDVLGNGVTIPDRRTTKRDIDILCVARLAPKKGIDYLLEATGLMDRRIQVSIVGDGDNRGALEAQANRLDTDIRFVGEVPPDTVDEYYRRSKLFVLPSTEGEGLPNAVLEAMAHGLPVIATPSGGIPSLIDNGTNGVLIPMRDPETLADQMGELLDNPDRRERLGENARQFVSENYSWPVIIDSLETIYERVTTEQ